MFKQALTVVATMALFVLSAFTSTSKQDKWIATLRLEGIKKPVVLTSDAVHGGYDTYSKKFFFLGKNHMFINKEDLNGTKVFNDLCITNASLQFQFELNNVAEYLPAKGSKDKTYQGNIIFNKRHPILGTVGVPKENELRISVAGDLSKLGLALTPEAKELFTGKFTLVFEKKS